VPRPKRNGAPPPARFLNVRTSDDIERLLQQELNALAASGVPENLIGRSTLVRSLLLAALDGGAQAPVPIAERLKRGVAREVLHEVIMAMEAASNRAIAEMIARLPVLLEEELGFRPRAGVAASPAQQAQAG